MATCQKSVLQSLESWIVLAHHLLHRVQGHLVLPPLRAVVFWSRPPFLRVCRLIISFSALLSRSLVFINVFVWAWKWIVWWAARLDGPRSCASYYVIDTLYRFYSTQFNIHKHNICTNTEWLQLQFILVVHIVKTVTNITKVRPSRPRSAQLVPLQDCSYATASHSRYPKDVPSIIHMRAHVIWMWCVIRRASRGGEWVGATSSACSLCCINRPKMLRCILKFTAIRSFLCSPSFPPSLSPPSRVSPIVLLQLTKVWSRVGETLIDFCESGMGDMQLQHEWRSEIDALRARA